VKTDMPVEAKVDIKPLHVSMRVTSRGTSLCTSSRGRNAADPAKYDHPVTMLYVDVDADRLTLVHYATRGTGRA